VKTKLERKKSFSLNRGERLRGGGKAISGVEGNPIDWGRGEDLQVGKKKRKTLGPN